MNKLRGKETYLIAFDLAIKCSKNSMVHLSFSIMAKRPIHRKKFITSDNQIRHGFWFK